MGSQTIDLVQQRGALLVAQVLRHGERRALLGLFFRVPGAVSHLHIVDQHRTAEYRVIRRILLVVLRAELDPVAVLLAPLDQTALKIGFRLGELLQVQKTEVDIVYQQAVDELITLIR